MATFSNQASLTYNGIVTASNIATGELRDALDVGKTAVTNQYSTENPVVTYTINIVNDGTTPFTDLTITDNMGQYTPEGGIAPVYPLRYIEDSATLFINGEPASFDRVEAGPPTVFTGLDIPAGGNAVIVYDAHTTEFAPPTSGGNIQNIATITGTGFSPITATEIVTPAPEVNLNFVKTITPTVVSDGDTVTYTMVISNTGNTPVTVAENAIVEDRLNPILTNLRAEFNGTPWTENTNYTYNETTGAFTTTSNQIAVPAATYTQDPVTGEWTSSPGISTLVLTGTI